MYALIEIDDAGSPGGLTGPQLAGDGGTVLVPRGGLDAPGGLEVGGAAAAQVEVRVQAHVMVAGDDEFEGDVDVLEPIEALLVLVDAPAAGQVARVHEDVSGGQVPRHGRRAVCGDVRVGDEEEGRLDLARGRGGAGGGVGGGGGIGHGCLHARAFPSPMGWLPAQRQEEVGDIFAGACQ